MLMFMPVITPKLLYKKSKNVGGKIISRVLFGRDYLPLNQTSYDALQILESVRDESPSVVFLSFLVELLFSTFLSICCSSQRLFVCSIFTQPLLKSNQLPLELREVKVKATKPCAYRLKSTSKQLQYCIRSRCFLSI